MDIPAVYSFLGFPGWGPVHLYLPHQGDPAGAALRLGAALEACQADGNGPGGLVAGFLRCHLQAEPLGSPEFRRDCRYRYLIVYRPQGRWPLRITAWRHPIAEQGWRRRCGPIELDGFLRRFHPCRGTQRLAWSA
jgi:hypothetical protein